MTEDEVTPSLKLTSDQLVRIFDFLIKLPITFFALTDISVNIELATIIALYIPQLRTLDTLAITYAGMSELEIKKIINALPKEATNTRALEVNFDGNNMGDKGALAISNYLLQDYCNITNLNIHSNEIGPIGATALAVALARNSSLTMLSAGSNRMTDIGIINIFDQLATNPNTGLIGFEWLQNCLTEEGVRQIATALKNIPSIYD